MLRWLWAGFGTKWDVGRWEGSLASTSPSISPRSDMQLERAAGQLQECGGGVGANPTANVVSELVALWERYSCRAAPSTGRGSSSCLQARGVCHFCFVVPPPPPASPQLLPNFAPAPRFFAHQEHPMARTTSSCAGSPHFVTSMPHPMSLATHPAR